MKENTHEALIDRKTFELAQQKFTAERERTSFAPRNPAYFLKQLFVCGHCGKGLTGRTETDRTTRKKTVIYVCPTYVAGRCNGHPASCGYQRITHDDAERLLLDKMAELNLPFDDDPSTEARVSLETHLARLGQEDEEARLTWWDQLREGVEALLDHLKHSYGVQGEVVL